MTQMFKKLYLLGSSFIALVIALFLISNRGFSEKKLDYVTKNSLVEEDSESLNMSLAFQKSLRNIASSINPSVVNIRNKKKAQQPQASSPTEDLLRKFFGDFPSPNPPTQGEVMGSGFIISSDGYILSNHHVVSDSEELTVTTEDGKEYKAELIGSDEKTDIGLIKIIDPEATLVVAPLGDSSEVEPGDLAIAIGNPFGLNWTMSFGIVSAKGRNSSVEANAPYKNYIQTDVALNQGNSGGPLINIRGQVIGINSSIYSLSGGSIGISFSIPINVAKNIAEQLLQNGNVSRGSLGITAQELNSDLAKYYKLPTKSGVLVSGINPGSAADKAGIRPGDIIVATDNKPIKDIGGLIAEVSSRKPNTPVELSVIRDGKPIKITVITELFEDNVANTKGLSSKKTKDSSSGSFEWGGLTLMDIETAKQEYNFDTDLTKGVVIVSIDRDSIDLYNKGIEAGDIILKANQIPINNINDFKKVADSKSILLHLQKRNGQFFVLVENKK